MSVRAAVIGTGFGSHVVAKVYRDVGIEVAEVASPRDVAAVEAACALPVDLVSIHSPPFLHARDVGIALDHGRNVLCDKPFGASVEEARAMLARAEAAGVIHLLNFEFRCDPPHSAVKALIDEGAIGEVRHIHWPMFSSGSRVPLRKYGWLFDKARAGGWIGAYGSHVFDALRWFAGEIVDIAGEGRTDVAERPDREGVPHRCTAEDAFFARLRFASGATAIVDTAYAAPANRPRIITIIGSAGLIEWGPNDVKVRGAAEDRDIRFESFAGDPHLPGMRPWAEAVRDAIGERRQIAPSFRDGLACAATMARLKASAAA